MTHKEVIERHRLEAIASDATKSEPERELAREQMQRLREAATARAELRKLKSEKPAEEPVSDLPVPVKPTQLEGESKDDFEIRLKDYWCDMRLELESRLDCYQTERWFILVGDLKPRLEMFCGNQEEYQKALALWQTCLDSYAAQKVLDSPTSSHSARSSAARTIRKTDARLKELCPRIRRRLTPTRLHNLMP